MKSKIETAFEMFERLFDGKYDPLQFSCDMEQYLYDNYQEMLSEDPVLAIAGCWWTWHGSSPLRRTCCVSSTVWRC